ncbi:MAG: DNA-processing protein DprA [Candidatus Gallimonas sp.]
MDYTADETAIIWLCAQNFDYGTRVRLLRAASRPQNLLTEFGKISQSVIKRGEMRVYNNDCRSPEKSAEAVIAGMRDCGAYAVTLLSEDYPDSLKVIPDPPLALFCIGRRELLKKKKFTIVGSRITPPWAAKEARLVSERLAERFVVATGFAEGGDRAAIDGALGGGNLICVLPLGIDGCYPAAHHALKEQVREKGLLVSEYAPGTGLKKYHFHARNRILAGLSEGVLVASAGRKSGALITANFALEFGRDVFAFPYNPGIAQGAGCNELIKSGAYLCTGAEDIFACYGISSPSRERTELSETERRVLEVLRSEGELHAAVIAERAGIPVYEAAATLSSLEVKNLAVKAGGNRYSAL